MSTNKAIIIIPVTGQGTEVVTNGINLLTIINVLRTIEAGFCRMLVEQAKEEVGSNRDQNKRIK